MSTPLSKNAVRFIFGCMETSSFRTQPNSNFELENQPTFNVVIVYEDFAAGKHAKETYDYLVHQLGNHYEFTNQMWKFDVLGNLKMKEMAVKDAVSADLIIISTHGIGDLPQAVKSWIEQWSAQKGHAMALVTLVDRPAVLAEDTFGVASLRSYLQTAARRAHIDFFAQPTDWPEREEDFSIQQISERAERTSNIMADFIQHRAPCAPEHSFAPPYVAAYRWGINE